MTSTLTEKAVAGRRVTFTYYRDLEKTDAVTHPGIITGTEPGFSEGTLIARVRLDGKRSSMHIPATYEGLTYLDEIVPVPELPMGRFLPFSSDQNGFYEKADVLIAAIGEDGEDPIVVTDDLAKARAAVTDYADWTGLDPDYMGLDHLRPCWAAFTWEPEDWECPWTVNWAAAEGDDQAVHIYYLPA
jgi:hypothetical protein